MRKTKIVSTLGPASNDLETIVALIHAGANVFRFNFSHGDHPEQLGRMNLVKQAMKETGIKVGLMLDTKGAEIRTGENVDDAVFHYDTGDKIILTMNTGIQNVKDRIDVTYAGLFDDVEVGGQILFDDGLLGTTILSKDAKKRELTLGVQNPAELGSKKGVNAPGVSLKLKGLTDKDRDDIKFGVEQGIHFIAASFVRKPSDVQDLRDLLEEVGGQDVLIIPKIESQEGINNADEIIRLADGVMVARGDMGVEIPYEEVPAVEQELIHKANLIGKPVITATQMLDSMQENPRPTRAEVTDVAFAVLQGTDATMLSGESANGDYPVESVHTMAVIDERADKMRPLHSPVLNELKQSGSITTTTAIAAVTAAERVSAKAIITLTSSGYTARQISRLKPAAPIIALTYTERTASQLLLSWGVTPMVLPKGDAYEDLIAQAEQRLIKEGVVAAGDVIVIVVGLPLYQAGSTNNVLISRVNEDAAKD
ncbi:MULTISPECIES: pyruvate kinase [Lacticaseibacillus]|uniref:Pyruvate kinase n=1 Tax=Lacticaseibacillus hegangensis TaxID=2486010 RepID=A0ABW4D0J7_9LACO|nr:MULTISPECIES: pyruvate kinase [Lacticaseibacillus]